MNALTQEDKRCLERVRERHNADAVNVNDGKRFYTAWADCFNDRNNLLKLIDRLTSCDAAADRRVTECEKCGLQCTHPKDCVCDEPGCPRVKTPTEAALPLTREQLIPLICCSMTECPLKEIAKEKGIELDCEAGFFDCRADAVLARVGALKRPMDATKLTQVVLATKKRWGSNYPPTEGGAVVITRRGFLSGIIAAAVAPAIIRPGLLMPIKPPRMIWRGHRTFTLIDAMSYDDMRRIAKLLTDANDLLEEIPWTHAPENTITFSRGA